MKILGQRLTGLHAALGNSHDMAVAMIEKRTKVRIAQTTYSSYLGGRKTPGAFNLAVLAKAFRVSTDYLCGLTDDQRAVSDILARLAALDLPDDIAQAARDLLDVSPEDRQALILQIRAAKTANIKWRALAKMAGLPNAEALRAAVNSTGTEGTGVVEPSLELP